MDEIHEGKVPIKEFSCKIRSVKDDNFSISAGMVPSKSLP